MTPDTIPQSVLFPDLFDKPLVATFNQEHASSDGGAVLLKAAERVYGLVKAFARCLADKRAPGKIRHTLADLIGQRVFGIACGHPDGNDADHLADDPIHKLLLGRDPVSGAPLASQPTISRFENGARRSVLYRMGRELAACVIERHRRRLQGRARRITIDLDPTDDLTHGAPAAHVLQRALWRLVLSADAGVSELRPRGGAVSVRGGAAAREGSGRQRDPRAAVSAASAAAAAFPRARFLVRLDGGFATPGDLRFSGCGAPARLRRGDGEERGVAAACGVRHAGGPRAERGPWRDRARLYRHRYAARTWGHERRVVIKAEVVRLGDREPRTTRGSW